MSKRDAAWIAGVPSAVAFALVAGWSFINWRMPPPIWDWQPFGRGMVMFLVLAACLYTWFIRALVK